MTSVDQRDYNQFINPSNDHTYLMKTEIDHALTWMNEKKTEIKIN